MRVAVHLHLYYLDMWHDFEPLLANLDGYECDLFVTLVKEDHGVMVKILKFNKNAKVFVVENRGYDMGPFFYFLQKIDLEKYDYVIKLHTKNKSNKTDVNSYCVPRGYWFKLMAEAVIGSKSIVKRNFFELQSDKKLGMIGSKYLITGPTKWCKLEESDIIATMNLLGFHNFIFEDFRFVVGAMFVVRSSVLKIFQSSHFSIGDFSRTEPAVKNGTLAHAMERVLGAVVIAQGYKICGFDKNMRFEILSFLQQTEKFLRKLRKFLVSKLFGSVAKICKILGGKR